MPRIPIPARDDAPAAAKSMLDAVNARLDFVPRLFRLLSLSPHVLAGFQTLSDELTGALDVKMRSRIALAVAQVNECDYCLSSHSYLGMNYAHIGPDEISLNRQGMSRDRKAAAAVHFAMRVAETGGGVTDAEVATMRAAGYADREIIEIVAIAAQSVLTNFVNNVAATGVDFPLVAAAEAA